MPTRAAFRDQTCQSALRCALCLAKKISMSLRIDAKTLPDGQISECAVQPQLQKYFASTPVDYRPKSMVIPHCPVPTRGADPASSQTRDGMRWTRECQARNGNRRASPTRERFATRETNDALRGRPSRVVLTPVAGAKLAEACRPDRARTEP